MRRGFVWLALSVIAVFGLSIFAAKLRDSSSSDIILAQTCPLSGPAAELGVGVRDGANAFFDYYNKNPNNKQKIKLITLDDGYEPKLSEKNAEILVKKYKADAFFGVVGTPTAMSAMLVANKYDVPFLMPITGAKFLRQEGFGIVNLRTGYEDETKSLVDYAVSKQGVGRIAVAYQNDAFGADGLDGVKRALEGYGLKECASVAISRNSVSIKYALSEIISKKPDAIIIIAPYLPTGELIKRAKAAGLDKTLFCATSFVDSKQLKNELGENLRNVIVSEVVPDPLKDNSEMAKLYKSVFISKYGIQKASRMSYEGFISAALAVQILSKTSWVLSPKLVVNKPVGSIYGMRLDANRNNGMLGVVHINELWNK